MMGGDLWWVWIAAGVALAIVEVLVTGFIFLGFALGAVAVGLILLAGGLMADWLSGSPSALLLAFALLSVVAWLVLRKVIGIRHGQSRIIEKDINDH